MKLFIVSIKTYSVNIASDVLRVVVDLVSADPERGYHCIKHYPLIAIPNVPHTLRRAFLELLRVLVHHFNRFLMNMRHCFQIQPHATHAGDHMIELMLFFIVAIGKPFRYRQLHVVRVD